ncbi:hypothetical protein BMR1_03g01745 [Babesia microti strain RI]|uniref:Uncharacterized protein n=1 Tax=Babesia microti (strain RI) TaxID=1133968 RepID=A0A1R4ABK5_BABMR|nr:hypothetical protein BMR1_03g01745 [Babesia microti strain RI]SJK86378.1 hypothetical protein BMR1_03g01745 [Babesia microti strain RI]|eukprot:XP_021338540.1 hypothetical protein BMR1_03g01745 [Babesia microti strain RI]
MDYCWGPIQVEQFLNFADELPQHGIFKHIFKYLNGIPFVEKTILLLKSSANIVESQVNIQSFSARIENVYLSSFLTRKFINFASEHSLSVVSHDLDFPFTIHQSVLKVKVSKEQFERLGLAVKRGSFQENKPFAIALDKITPNVEKRYQGLLGSTRTNARSVIIVSRKAIDHNTWDLLKDIIDGPNLTLQSTSCAISRMESFLLKFTPQNDDEIKLNKNEKVEQTQKRVREEFIPVESKCNDFKMIAKYENEMIVYARHENLFKKVYFTIKRNFTSKNFDPWQVIQDFETARIKNIWHTILDNESSQYRVIENLLIDLGKLIIGDTKDSNDCYASQNDDLLSLKIVLGNTVSFGHIVNLLRVAFVQSKKVDEGTMFAMTVVGLNPFKDSKSMIGCEEACHLICQKHNGKVYLIGINVKS